MAGLAPAPYAGMILADFGADVIRVDRSPTAGSRPDPTRDYLARGKRSIGINMNCPRELAAPEIPNAIERFSAGAMRAIMPLTAPNPVHANPPPTRVPAPRMNSVGSFTIAIHSRPAAYSKAPTMTDALATKAANPKSVFSDNPADHTEGMSYLNNLPRRLITLYLPLGLILLILLFPFYWMGLTSVKPDEQLLDRFVNRPDDLGAIAFEAIVARHGPMVMRISRATLRDVHHAEDGGEPDGH